MTGFDELVVGGVLIAPFIRYALGAAVLLAGLRPLLRLVGFDRAFSNPPLVTLCLYVLILAVLVVI